MRIIVTGAGGFVGRHLVANLAQYEVVAIDHTSALIPNLPHVTAVTADISDVQALQDVFAGGCDAVVHLATVPGGAAEQDPALAQRVNVDGSMALAQMAARAGQRPRFVFASSIAVFGEPLPAQVDDATPLNPSLLYGGHKAMMEQWLAVLSRRGEIDALSVRLSGVVARPQGPSGMKSAFMSDVFHALKAERKFVMPVSRDATSWLTSVRCVVANLKHALTIDPQSLPADRTLTLPALRIGMGGLIDEIGRQVGVATGLISHDPDQAIEQAFGRLPPLATTAADRLGFVSDVSLVALVEAVLTQMRAS